MFVTVSRTSPTRDRSKHLELMGGGVWVGVVVVDGGRGEG